MVYLELLSFSHLTILASRDDNTLHLHNHMYRTVERFFVRYTLHPSNFEPHLHSYIHHAHHHYHSQQE